jgi:ATP/maltotriose-dependent transcriptional regulator MalT
MGGGDVVAHAMDPFMANFALPELIEAAARREDTEAAAVAFARLTETTQPTRTDWAVGIEERCRALLAGGDDAEAAYREAIARLSRTKLRPDLARAHLLYGEWLRREDRRAEARERLRSAHDLFVDVGMEAFAGRARRELAGTGERVHHPGPRLRDELTGQEEQIARLARDGLSNREIGGTLYLSSRTVEWHLRKVFAKLGIRSRNQLAAALSDGVVRGGRP